jgi:hypothetical protein
MIFGWSIQPLAINLQREIRVPATLARLSNLASFFKNTGDLRPNTMLTVETYQTSSYCLSDEAHLTLLTILNIDRHDSSMASLGPLI